MPPAIRRRDLFAAIVACLAVQRPAGTTGSAESTPPASPVATPAVTGDCAALGPYFLAVAEAVEGNAGYATMRTGAFNALSLSDETAAEAVTGLDTLFAEIEAIAQDAFARLPDVAAPSFVRSSSCPLRAPASRRIHRLRPANPSAAVRPRHGGSPGRRAQSCCARCARCGGFCRR